MFSIVINDKLLVFEPIHMKSGFKRAYFLKIWRIDWQNSYFQRLNLQSKQINNLGRRMFDHNLQIEYLKVRLITEI